MTSRILAALFATTAFLAINTATFAGLNDDDAPQVNAPQATPHEEAYQGIDHPQLPHNSQPQFDELEQTFNDKNNNLGSRIRRALEDEKTSRALGGHIDGLLSQKNIQTIMTKPGFLGWFGTPLKDQLQQLKNNDKLCVLAANAHLFFNNLDEHQRHERLKALDRMNKKHIYQLLECLKDPACLEKWNQFKPYRQDQILESLKFFHSDQIPLVLHHLGFLSLLDHRQVIVNDFYHKAPYTTLYQSLSQLKKEFLPVLFENQDLLFMTFQTLDNALPIIKKINSLKDVQEFERAVQHIKSKKKTLSRYGITHDEHAKIILSLLSHGAK